MNTMASKLPLCHANLILLRFCHNGRTERTYTGYLKGMLSQLVYSVSMTNFLLKYSSIKDSGKMHL